MAMASWRLQHLVHMEAAYYRLRRSSLEVHFNDYYTDLSEPDRQAIMAERNSSHTLINFSRYEARLERSFHKSLTALQRLRAERKSEIADRSQFQAIPDSAVAQAIAAKAPDVPATNKFTPPATPADPVPGHRTPPLAFSSVFDQHH
jgi:hypothetical protein